MQRANGRQKQNSYRFKPRARDTPLDENVGASCSSSGNNARHETPGLNSNNNGSQKCAGGHSSTAIHSKDNKLPQGKPTSELYTTNQHPSQQPSPGPSRLYTKDSFIQPNKDSNAGRKLELSSPNDDKSTRFVRRPEENNRSSAPSASSSNMDKEGWQTIQRSRPVSTRTKTPSQKPSSQIPTGGGGQQRLVEQAALSGGSPPMKEATTKISSEPVVTPPNGSQNPVASNSAKKKNKKKKSALSKEERKKKREEEIFKELYKPKDSRVTLLNSDVFQKIKSGSSNTPSVSVGAFQFSPTPIPSQASVCDFPTLLHSASNLNESPQFKSFATALSMSSAILPPHACLKTGESIKVKTPSSAVLSPPCSSSASLLLLEESVKKPKLSKRLITVNICDMLETPRNRNGVANKQISRKSKHDRLSAIRDNPKLTVGNLLDSSGPVVIHRGKIKQKKKKPSKLKKSILQSREARKATVHLSLKVSPSESTDDEDKKIGSDLLKCDKLKDSGDEISCAGLDSITDLRHSVTSEESGTPPENKSEFLPENSDFSRLENSEAVPENSPKKSFKELIEEAEESSKTPPAIPASAIQLVKFQMHTRKFRDYCDMFVTKELHGLVIPLMQELHRLQDRIYKTDPIKLQTKRRFVNGIKEVLSSMRLRKVQLVILAPDIEPHSGDGGLDDKTSEVLSLAAEKNIPYIFSGNRYILGRCIKQTKSPVSAIAILDKQSVEDMFNKLLEAAESLREQYKVEFNTRIQAVMANGG
ncbi:selenocysteine insertion sequence-binding protein 2-like [Folsomia candida]|nr:selenocysteine insertion sequence-binding protein 2-like [Folsomia candida]XP_035712512.1 selenocysteine insertion sequence-binding protein 2-like [Folsomia candida]